MIKKKSGNQKYVIALLNVEPEEGDPYKIPVPVPYDDSLSKLKRHVLDWGKKNLPDACVSTLDTDIAKAPDIEFVSAIFNKEAEDAYLILDPSFEKVRDFGGNNHQNNNKGDRHDN